MEEMRASYEGRLRQREEEGATAVAQLRAEMEALLQQRDERMRQLASQHQARLDEVREELKQAGAVAVEAVTADTREAQALQLAELRAAHTGREAQLQVRCEEAERLHARARSQLSSLESRHAEAIAELEGLRRAALEAPRAADTAVVAEAARVQLLEAAVQAAQGRATQAEAAAQASDVQLRRLNSAARLHESARRESERALKVELSRRRKCVRCGALTEVAHDTSLRDKQLQRMITEMDARHVQEIATKQARIDELERQQLHTAVSYEVDAAAAAGPLHSSQAAAAAAAAAVVVAEGTPPGRPAARGSASAARSGLSRVGSLGDGGSNTASSMARLLADHKRAREHNRRREQLAAARRVQQAGERAAAATGTTRLQPQHSMQLVQASSRASSGSASPLDMGRTSSSSPPTRSSSAESLDQRLRQAAAGLDGATHM
eukprot:COSAG01_NODE_6137_length_3829_cov_8.621448_3_plen_437_part_00